ncbi:MAG: hypothetical protein U9N76_00985 [Candidatus Marinimicrobia bacterium]|nr:hypothetical protein [Candidatus Neomarinimicrobiota bacterium]
MGNTKRLVALDVFRGATIALMITVNNPGSWGHIYSPLEHSKWSGCTPTDLVFPFFLFIVGVSMWFAFRKYNHEFTKPAVVKIIKRAFIIFGIGLFLNALRPVSGVGEFFTNWRIVGVLQRIGIAYGIGSLIVLYFNEKKIIWISAILLLGYWVLLAFTGGFSLEGNLVRQVDMFLLGSSHIYHGYDGIPFDPEGLLSTIPAIVTPILGYFAGKIITTLSDNKEIVKKLIIRGIGFTILGYFWGFFFPINKPIWTSSYVIYSGGLSMIILGIAIYLIDVKGYKKLTQPFVVFGMNPLFIFVLSSFVAKTLVYILRWETADGSIMTGKLWLYQNIFMPLANNVEINASLLFAVVTIIIYWLIVDILYKKNIFIKI